MIGTGRYWSSRLDNQLRGRSGRQGDPGSSVFFASMEDQLVEHYAPDADPPHDVAADGLVADPGAHWTVAHAQRVAEGANLEIHRNTWRYSKLVDDQRRLVLEQRYRVLTTGAALQALARRCPQRYAELSATACRRRSTTPPGRSSSTTSMPAGRTISPRWPASARAFTCARSAAASTR